MSSNLLTQLNNQVEVTMSTAPKTYFTSQQYLALERTASYKSEYFRGEIFAMAGASARHNLIVSNSLVVLSNQLKSRPCLVYPSDLKVEVRATGLISYPDVSVVCGEPELGYEHGEVLHNPLVIIEVISESTEAYDRGKKFQHYQRLPSLKHFVLIAQDRPSVEVFTRQANDSWLLTSANQLDQAIRLEEIDCTLPLQEVYSKVTFDPVGEVKPDTKEKFQTEN